MAKRKLRERYVSDDPKSRRYFENERYAPPPGEGSYTIKPAQAQADLDVSRPTLNRYGRRWFLGKKNPAGTRMWSRQDEDSAKRRREEKAADRKITKKQRQALVEASERSAARQKAAQERYNSSEEVNRRKKINDLYADMEGSKRTLSRYQGLLRKLKCQNDDRATCKELREDIEKEKRVYKEAKAAYEKAKAE